jgi:hypothetical protein
MKKHKDIEPCFATMGIELVARCMTVWASAKAMILFLSSGFTAMATRLTEQNCWTQIFPVWFTLRYFENRNGGPQDATRTVIHTKAE